MNEIICGDCLSAMPTMPANSVDSIITDPPYGLDFMGKSWDHGVPGVEFWQAALRVAKPGAILMAFGGTRTFHRLACAIEDAGWEMRDTMCWLYGSGFPKSLDISKAIDKCGAVQVAWFGPWFRQWREEHNITQKQVAALFPSKTGGLTGCVANWELGFNMPTPDQFNAIRDKFGLPFDSIQEAEREVVGHSNINVYQGRGPFGDSMAGEDYGKSPITAPSTPAAHLWQGWGTALKPAHEDIIIAQKPLDLPTECGIILENLYQLEAQLWSLLDVNTAEKLFKSNHPDYDAVCAFAQWRADEKHSIQEDLFAQMDTLQFASVMTSCLNTVTSWSNTLADALGDGKMSITEMESSPTIDLKTLNSCLLALTPSSIIGAAITQPGSWQNVLPAARYLSAVVAKLNSTPQRFAAESATVSALISRQEEEGLNLTPSFSPIIVAMKPLEGTYAENAQKWGVAGLNIDGGRIGTEKISVHGYQGQGIYGVGGKASYTTKANGGETKPTYTEAQGRWPANLLLDEEAARLLDEQSGEREVSGTAQLGKLNNAGHAIFGSCDTGYKSAMPNDHGGASRFFYTSKASSSERNAGLEDMEEYDHYSEDTPTPQRDKRKQVSVANTHPTVKPVSLMRYLCKLTRTPTGGVVLDPFMGSGTTGVACILEHRDFIGIEIDEGYAEIARKRIADMTGPLFIPPEVKHGDSYLYN